MQQQSCNKKGTRKNSNFDFFFTFYPIFTKVNVSRIVSRIFLKFDYIYLHPRRYSFKWRYHLLPRVHTLPSPTITIIQQPDHKSDN